MDVDRQVCFLVYPWYRVFAEVLAVRASERF
jgi:hypothetical protein